MQRYNMLCLLIVCDLILSWLVKEASYNLHVYLLEEVCYPLKWTNIKHLLICHVEFIIVFAIISIMSKDVHLDILY